MNLAGVGPLELLVVLLVAFLVLGPERMVDTARSVGRTIADVRRTFSGFPTSLEDLLEPEETPERSANDGPGVPRPRRRTAAADDAPPPDPPSPEA